MFCFLFCVFCVSVLLSVLFLPTYKVVYFLFVYNFTEHCHRVETQMRLISIISHICFVFNLTDPQPSHLTSNLFFFDLILRISNHS